MKRYKNKQLNKVNIDSKEKGEMSRRNFLLGAGSLVIGGALGGGLLSGCKEEITTTMTVATTKTVSVPTTVEIPVTSTVTETGYLTETATVTETATEAKTITVTDSTGREVTLNLPINGVCYLGPTVAEGLKIIDVWDKVVAVDNYTIDTTLFPELADMPVIAFTESGTVDYESIITLEPDILFVLATPGSFDVDSLREALEPEIPVVGVFDIYDTNTWSSGIELLGTIMQKEEEAQEFITFAQNIQDNISTKTSALSDEEKPKFFLKTIGYTTDQLCTYTDEFAFMKQLAEVTGSVNIAADLPSTAGWVQDVDTEWLMTEEYAFILALTYDMYSPGVTGYGVTDTAVTQDYLDEVSQLDAFSLSKAVADGNVSLADTYFFSTPRHFILMEYVAKMFHPELFADLDPKATHQEYLTRFMRVDFDLDESGVFFYPEP
jgi:iron complex transport system substrate-binding protein